MKPYSKWDTCRQSAIIVLFFSTILCLPARSAELSLLKDWTQQGESFDYDAWLRDDQRTPAQSITELSEAITANPSPVKDIDRIMRNVNFFAYKLAKNDSHTQSNAFSKILLTPRIAIFDDRRMLEGAIYVDADLASDQFQQELAQRMDRNPEDPQLIALAGWCLLNEGEKRVSSVLKIAQSRHPIDQPWRQDRFLYWSTLAAMRLGNEEAYGVWQEAISKETAFCEMGIGVDLLYMRNPRVTEVVSSLLWKKGANSPGSILAVLSRSVDVDVSVMISMVPYEEHPTREEYERLTQWLLDPARVYRR